MRMLIGLSLLLLGVNGFAEVRKFNGGTISINDVSDFYVASYDHENMKYIVDKKAKLCFAYIEKTAKEGSVTGGFGLGVGTAMAMVPCANLKSRPEWKTLITWE